MHKIIKILNLVLLIISIILALKIFTNKSYSTKIINSLYNYFSNFIMLQGKEMSVSNSLNYIKIDQYEYTNASSSIYSPFNGSIKEVYDDKIVIKCENGYDLVFEKIINIKVKKYDYLNSDDFIANFIESYIMYFYFNNTRYSYEEVIERI